MYSICVYIYIYIYSVTLRSHVCSSFHWLRIKKTWRVKSLDDTLMIRGGKMATISQWFSFLVMLWAMLIFGVLIALQMNLGSAGIRNVINSQLNKIKKTKEERLMEITHNVYFDVEINGEPAGRIVIGLYGKAVPLTVENFRGLCTGEYGISMKSGKPLHFKGTKFHRIYRKVLIMGGDVNNEDGKGGESIYGKEFAVENFKASHSGKGILAMINDGQGTNDSRFFITMVKTAWFEGRQVVFGKVISGMDVVYKIEAQGGHAGFPKSEVVIADSGELPLKPKGDEVRHQKVYLWLWTVGELLL